MKKKEDALRLAETLVGIGEQFGKETIAYLTNMEQPLGYAVGNWLEVKESIDGLRGEGPADVMQITHLLAGTTIYLGKKASTVEEGIEKSKGAVADGSAFAKWVDIVRAHNGDTTVIEDPTRYPPASTIEPVKAKRSGYITEMDAFAMGMISLELGAGRRTKEDDVDPAAGFVLHKKVGDSVEENETLATLHTNNEAIISGCKDDMLKAITLSDNQPALNEQITHRVDKSGIHDYKS
jgi:pyrimidine-nucleoside phosphorylase